MNNKLITKSIVLVAGMVLIVLSTGCQEAPRDSQTSLSDQIYKRNIVAYKALEAGDYKTAEREYSLAVQIPHDDRNSSVQVVSALGSIGWINLRAGNFEKAKSYLEQAVKTLDNVDSSNPILMKVLLDLSFVYQKTGQLQQAQQALERAIAIGNSASIVDKTTFALCLVNLASLLYDSHHPEKIAPLTQQAFAITRELSDEQPEQANNLYKQLRSLCLKTGQHKLASNCLEQSQTLSQK